MSSEFDRRYTDTCCKNRKGIAPELDFDVPLQNVYERRRSPFDLMQCCVELQGDYNVLLQVLFEEASKIPSHEDIQPMNRCCPIARAGPLD